MTILISTLKHIYISIYLYIYIDNHTDTGKRVFKPTGFVERRSEAGIIASGIRKGRDAINTYIDANAVTRDKFYLQVSVGCTSYLELFRAI